MKKQIKISDDFFQGEDAVKSTPAEGKTTDSAALQVILGTAETTEGKPPPAPEKSDRANTPPFSREKEAPAGLAALFLLPLSLAGAALRLWGLVVRSSVPRSRG